MLKVGIYSNVALGVLAAGLLVNFGRVWLTHTPVRAESSPPFPYTAVLEQTPYDAQGNAGSKMTVTWAVRSDGSQVTKLETSRLRQRIIDMASGRKILIDDAHHFKSTTAYKDWTPERWLRNPTSGCLTSAERENSAKPDANLADTAAGYRAIRVVRGSTTTWYALDAGCAMIQSMADWGGGAKTEEHLVSLVYGEPADDLFATLPEFR